jgi:hypothetical protein
MGLDPRRYDLHDGSGLSASTACRRRRWWTSCGPWTRTRRARVAVHAGGLGESDGSLRHRLLDDSTRGEIQAKTGTLNGVSTLAGYAKAASGKTYAFAILLNGPGVTESRGHAYQDRVLRTLVKRGRGGAQRSGRRLQRFARFARVAACCARPCGAPSLRCQKNLTPSAAICDQIHMIRF